MLNKQGRQWLPYNQCVIDWSKLLKCSQEFWFEGRISIKLVVKVLVFFQWCSCSELTWVFFSPASEKLAFLLYYATPLLSRYLPSDHLFFLRLLTSGMFRLCKQSISQQELNEAHTYLKLFAAQATVFYGKHDVHSSKYKEFFGCLSFLQEILVLFLKRSHSFQWAEGITN